jgi:hypothetical protein
MTYIEKLLTHPVLREENKEGSTEGSGGAQNPPADDPKAASVTALRAEKADLEKRLTEAMAKVDQLTAKVHSDETKKLEEEGKFKELAERESQRASAAEAAAKERVAEVHQRLKDTELKARLAVEGVTDLDVYLLADRSKITIENGEVVGVEDVVRELKEKKPHFFRQEGTAPSGSSFSQNNPAPSGGPNSNTKDVTTLDAGAYKQYKSTFLAELRRGR